MDGHPRQNPAYRPATEKAPGTGLFPCPPGDGVAGRVRTYVRMDEATILHADVDSFFASVEQRDDPALRGRPVIVGAGVVLAASYEAKAYGVRTAMGGRQARSLCPQAIVVSPRMSAYSDASKAMFRVFEDATPLVEGLSIDEAFLDVRGMRRLAGTPTEIAVRLRRDVREKVGLPITVGVARTKFLAKVASGVAKPDGLLVVPPDDELGFLHPLPVERLWGVGPVTAAKLRSRGFLTVGQVAGLAETALVSMLGTRRRQTAPRPRPQPRPAARSAGPPPRLDRIAARARALAAIARRDRRHSRRTGRSGHRPYASRRAHGPHGRAAAALRRLHPGHALAHPAARDGRDARDPDDGARAARGRDCRRSSAAGSPSSASPSRTSRATAASSSCSRSRPRGALRSIPSSTRSARGSGRARSRGPCCSGASGASRCLYSRTSASRRARRRPGGWAPRRSAGAWRRPDGKSGGLAPRAPAPRPRARG